MRLESTLAATAALWIALAPQARAVVVNAPPAGINISVLSFSSYDAITTPVLLPDPVDVGAAEGLASVVLSFSDPSVEHVLGAVEKSLGGNGLWPASGAYAGLNTGVGSMSFGFAGGMNFAGGFVNYNPSAYDGIPTIEALDAGGNTLEIVSLNFGFGDPAAVGQGAYIGFSRATADIYALRLFAGEAVIDDLGFGVLAVPEPGTWLLMLGGLGALAARRRSRSSG